MLAHTLSWPYEHLVVIRCKKNTWFQAYVTNLWNSPTTPSQKALLRSLCCDNDNKWKRYLIWLENKVPGGCNENAQFWFGPTDYLDTGVLSTGIPLHDAIFLLVMCRGTCLRRPLGTRRPPRLFEKLESYCIQLASLIRRYSVLINCAKETNCKISSRKDLQTER